MGDLKHIEKLFELNRLLTSSKYPVSISTICDKLDCDRSTFFRIKNELSTLSGVEIVYNNQAEGYKLETLDGILHPIPGLWFKDDEIETLICFEHLAESLQTGFISDILKPFREKIDSLVKLHQIDTETWKNRIKIIQIASRKILPNIFRIVASAVLHRKKIQIMYKSVDDDSASDRVVSPQTLLCYRDNWYLDALCHKKEELRTFALSRISIAELLKKKAITVPLKKLKEHYADSYGIFSGPAQNTAKIQFSGDAAKIVAQEEWHPQQRGTRTENGFYLLELPYSKSDELIMDILRWGENAEVIEPKELRTEIAAIIKKMENNYNSRVN